MLKNVWILLALLLTASFAGQSCQEKLTAEFQQFALEANRRGPVAMDANIRWDRTVAGPGMRMTYHYTLTSLSSKEINRQTLTGQMKPALITMTCNNKQFKPSLQCGAAYIYSYKSKDGKDIARIGVNRDDCGY